MSEEKNHDSLPSRCGFVALIGAPNAGKSTITNNFVGSKVSIVSPKVQTTRTLVKGIGIYENTQIIFIDTPGIFKPKRRLDRAMVASSWSGVGDADITVLVVDAKRGFDDETRAIVNKLNKNKIEAVLLLNKIDLIQKEKLLGLSAEINAAGKFKETFFRRHFIKAAVDRSPVYGGAGFLKSAGNIRRAYRAALSLQKIKYVFPRFCVVILSFVHSMTSEEPQAAHNQKEGCASGSPLRYGSMRSNNTLQVTAKAYRGLSFL